MTVAPARQQTTQLLVIDQNINGWQDLANNAGIGVSVLILDLLQDGLTQIANAVTIYSNLDAIQILSHGSVASLQLGATTLNSDNLSHYTQQLSTIGNALSENGDLLLYGCNVAQGDAGQQFIEQLSVLTGADVAASTNLTGDANKGGDWLLETQTGTIEASSAISLQAQAAYQGMLATTRGVFAATDATNGTELWVTDGTAAGTSLLNDIVVGSIGSSPQYITSLGNGKTVFAVTNLTTYYKSYDIWVTDGTVAGTNLIKNSPPQTISADKLFFTAIGNGKILFGGSIGSSGFDGSLWVTDGTAAGTNIVITTNIYYSGSIAVLGNGKSLFSAHDSTNGSGLWITDGTTAGTSLVKGSFNPTFSPDPPQYITSLGNGKALFNAPSTNGYGLWMTDGTTAGTGLFRDIVAGIDNARPIFLGSGKAVLDVYNATTGHELWFTDGTALGTHFVKNGMGSFDSTSFTTLGNGKVLFSTTLGLWVTDETTAGTTLVKNIFIGTGDPYSQIITSLGNGKAVFSAYDSTNGYELWVTDGTTAGTNLIKDITVGINGSKPQFFTALGNGKATFSATDANNDTELWITDGTAAGTSLLKDINNIATESSYPSAVTLITGTNTNTAPNVLAGTTTVFTEQTPVTVAGTMTINDLNGDTDWNGGKLQVQITANNTINDSLALPTANNGGIWLNPTGNVLMANTTIIGTANATTVSNGSAWTFIFNASATNALVQSTARAIQFINNSDVPSTASRTVTFTATDKNAAFNSSAQTVSVNAVNDAPNLTSFTSAVANGNEDSEIAVTFASLQAQGNQADADGTVTTFVIKTVTSGTLKIGTDALTATAWSANNNTVDATHQAYWTPALNANGTLNAFTAVAKDNGGLESLTPVQAAINITAVNDAPVGVADNNAGDTVIEAGTSVVGDSSAVGNVLNNDTDVDSFLGFVDTKTVASVNNQAGNVGGMVSCLYGSLMLSVNGSYTYTLDNTKAATNALTAGQVVTDTFTYTVVDAHGASSTTTTLTINVTGSNDAPTLSNFTSVVASGNEDSSVTVTFASLQAQGNEADVDGTVTAFVIKAVNSGTLKIGTDALTATAWSASNNTVDATHQAYWTPALNANGTLNAFTAVAKDNGGLESLTPVQATVSIAAVNDAPSGTDKTISFNENSSYTFTAADFGFSDVDSNSLLAVKISSLPLAGSLKLNGILITGNASISVADMNNGQFTFSPAVNGSGDHYASFNFQVQDNGGTANNGVDLDGSANTLSFDVMASSSTPIVGTAGNDRLKGTVGADTLLGGAGDDSYYVNVAGDTITENTGEGADIAYSTATSYTLSANIETLIIAGAGVSGTGNAQNNYLMGNAGNNSLDGQGGADFMAGGAGNDSYTVDDKDDVIIEIQGAGSDTVYSSISYSLAANIENLVLTGTAINGFGNELSNQITGNNADNILGGGAGADTMIGLAGNDTYYVDDAGDVIIEAVNGGTDIVYSTTASYTLADNIETLIVWLSAVNGTGNAQDNYIIGNMGSNTLDGRAGNDVLYGDEGADTYIGGLGADSLNLTETTAATDTVRIATGDSLATVGGYDLVTGFKLGTDSFNTTGVDKLDLESAAIAANVTAADGIDSGVIRSHSINNGTISFDDINNYSSPLVISASTNIVNVFSYLQTNITGGNTVAFVAENNTFVFQDDGVTDTLVELVGVTATSVNNTGLAANSVWVI